MITVKETEENRPLFVLEAAQSTYAFKVLANGQVEHLYYGPKIEVLSSDGLMEAHEFPPGNSSVYGKEAAYFSPEDMRYEYSAPGKGDIREPMIEAVYADGSATIDPVYVSYEVSKGKPKGEELPVAYGKETEVETLQITCRDRNGSLEFVFSYSVFADCDVICRSMRIVNTGEDPVQIRRVLSMQLDLDPEAYVFHSFTGAWAREMKRSEIPLRAGRFSVGSMTGTSSNRANPFFMIARPDTAEDAGLCYGCNLIYSGNHYATAERSAYGKLRVMNGIQPVGFSWRLEKDEAFQTPEAVLCCSDRGFGELSRRMHRFVNDHIVRGYWQHRERPVLLNSWEANYFDISEIKVYNLAKAAKSAGIELFVIDDGWFGERNDDTSSLGDWTANKKKLSHGIKGLAEKITSMGLDFGIWVEPEMVSEKSKLFEAHPDWAMRIPGKEHSEGRNQMLLDLSRREVQDNVIGQMTELFSTPGISYVKWDMNRNFTDVFSASLPPERQGEVAHRYVLGLYRIMDTLTKAFPKILFEGCASGGNRFDLGILSYFPQIWASDDTDALCRCQIQEGYSYGYPQSTWTAHVSDVPNHQTLRRTPLETRFAVASAGVLGYECNLGDLPAEQLEEIREQIRLYKKWRKVLQFGTYYRGGSLLEAGDVLDGNATPDASWTVVSPEGEKAVSVILQQLVRPNTHLCIHRPKGLLPDAIYHVSGRVQQPKLIDFGGLVNYVAPIHVKQDGAVHHLLSRVVKLASETEEHTMSGSALLHAGIHLRQAFAGCGYNEQLRYFPDFASRMYFYERIHKSESDDAHDKK